MGCEVLRSVRIFRISVHILNMDRPAFKSGARSTRVPSWSNRVTLTEILLRFWYVGGGRHTEKFAVKSVDECRFRLTQPRRRFGQRVEHGLKVESRPADHLEHVRGRRLLLQRFA